MKDKLFALGRSPRVPIWWDVKRIKVVQAEMLKVSLPSEAGKVIKQGLHPVCRSPSVPSYSRYATADKRMGPHQRAPLPPLPSAGTHSHTHTHRMAAGMLWSSQEAISEQQEPFSPTASPGGVLQGRGELPVGLQTGEGPEIVLNFYRSH